MPEKDLNQLAEERNHLAAERTYLSWIRTSLAILGAGFAILKILVYHQAAHEHQAQVVGFSVVLLGVLLIIFALFQFMTEKGNRKASIFAALITSFIMIVSTLWLLFVSI